MKHYCQTLISTLLFMTLLAACESLTEDLTEISTAIDNGHSSHTDPASADGYFGRDHSDNEGIPNDNNLKGTSKSDNVSRAHGDDDGIPPDNALRPSSDQESNNEYWGRDHGNDDGIPPDTQSRNTAKPLTGNRTQGDSDGIPPDGQIRTNWGTYPAGGLFDENEESSTDEGSGN